MQPCLAATGADPTLPIVLAASLLVLGVVIAAVAIRRRKAGVALLVLAFPFLVGASLLGSASSALAQPGVPCTTPTAAPDPSPVPSCDPVDAIEGIGIDSDFALSVGDLLRLDFAPEEMASYVTTVSAALGMDGATAEATVRGEVEGTVINGPIPFDSSLLGVTGNSLTIPFDLAEQARGSIELGQLVIEIAYTYDDGCDDELTTIVTITHEIWVRA